MIATTSSVWAGRVKVSAYSPIVAGDIAVAQAEALNKALESAIEMSLQEIVPETTYNGLYPLFEREIIPNTDDFITNYHVDTRDVSELAYSIDVTVSVDETLLRKKLSSLGIIKEPGSPPLAAIYVTVEAPVALEQVQALAFLAEKEIGISLSSKGITVIPPAEDDIQARLIRPPQTELVLASEAVNSLADIAVGTIFRQSGEIEISADKVKIPMSVSIQMVEIATGSIIDIGLREAVAVIGTDDAKITGDLKQKIVDIAGKMAGSLNDKFVRGETTRTGYTLILENLQSSFRARNFLYSLIFKLGDEATMIPALFTSNIAQYTLWTDKEMPAIEKVMEEVQRNDDGFKYTVFENSLNIDFGVYDVEQTGVQEYGEEVMFYRRLPVAGVENPDDIKKIEFIPWHEVEENSTFKIANEAPLNMGILGKINPSRDHDLYKYLLPDGVSGLSIMVEQTGPGEMRPKVRVFSRDGVLLGVDTARRRGRNLYFELPIQAGISEVIISVEDDLGRYSSMFPYVITVGGIGLTKEHEPS